MLYVIACDGKSITQREVVIKDLFESEIDNHKEAAHSSIPKKNLTQQTEVPSENDDPKGLIQKREVIFVNKGE